MEWRKSLPAPAELKRLGANEIAKGKFYMRGHDREGRRTMYWRTERNDPKVRSLEEMKASLYYWCHVFEHQMDGAKDGSTCALVIDRVNNTLDMAILKAMIPVLQVHFPERVSKIYVAPAGLALRLVFNVISPLLNSQVREMVNMVPTCEALQQYVAPEQLPVRMGGRDEWEFDAARDAPDL